MHIPNPSPNHITRKVGESTLKYPRISFRPDDRIRGRGETVKFVVSSIQNKCALFNDTSNFPLPPSRKSHCPRTVVEVISKSPREGKSRGFNPIVQSDKDMLS